MRRIHKLIALGFMLATLASCTNKYARLGSEYGNPPPCDRPTFVVTHRGDFSEANKQDIISVLGEIGFWSHRQVIYAGDVDWKSGSPQQALGTIVAERDDYVVGYALPGKFIRLGYSPLQLRSPSAQSWASGPTFRGTFLHEAMHALTGAADMYAQDDGNPGLIMGLGFQRFNQLALGDINAAIAGGC